MTNAELIHIAKVTAQNEGWALDGRLGIAKSRRWPLFGRREYRVFARHPQGEWHTWVHIDEAGEVIGTGWRAGEPVGFVVARRSSSPSGAKAS